MCSRTPVILGVKAFWISASIISFSLRNENMESRRQDVKAFKGTDSRVISLKLAGSSLLPLLCTKIVQAVFHSAGIRPDSPIRERMSVRNDSRYGHLLKHIMDILSKGAWGSR